MKKMKVFLRIWTFLLTLLCFVGSAYSATVDVMIVFDSTAKAWVDSNGGMNTFAAEVIAKLNQSTANSSVSLSFRLAHAAVVSYTHSGDLGTDLDRLQRTSDGYMDNFHTLRNTYGADLVAMLVDTGSPWGTVGMGYELTSSSGQPGYAFTVSAIQSVDISHTLTHEVGHNFGSSHSRYQKDSPGPGLYSYSAGWYFEGTGSTDYSTIMAYTDDGYGNKYIEVPYFSNPDVSYDGGVTGHATNGDNAQTLKNTMGVVEAYRTAAAGDSNPDAFSFVDQTNVARSIVVTSNAITVSGINTAADISITGGEYSINGGSYTSASGTVNNGNTVMVQLQSSPNYSTTTGATLMIGGVFDTFNVTTLTTPDTDPNQFYFIDQTNVPINSEITSNTITVSGINAEIDISITGGKYSINSGPYTDLAGKVNNGDQVTVQLTSSGNYLMEVAANLIIGTKSDIFNVTTRSSTTPDPFTFVDQVNVPLNTALVSNVITVSGLGAEADIGIINGGEYKINSGSYTSGTAKVKNGDSVTVRQTSASSYLSTTNTTLTIGGVSDTFSVTTVAAPDSVPVQFTFTDQANVPLNTVITSNVIMVSGINIATTISVTGGTYSIKGRDYTSASGTIYNGETVTVQQVSSASYSTTTEITLTIGGVSDTFSVTTKDDTAPDQFTFTDQTNVPVSSVITSDEITISGMNGAAVISIIGGAYSINGGAYRSTSSIVHDGDKVTVQLTSSGSYSTKTDTTLNIGGVSDTFSVTTIPSPDETPPDQFTFTDQKDAALNTLVTSNEITVSGITSPAAISITGGTYSVNGGPYTNESGTVEDGDTVSVQQMSSGSYSTTTDTTLTIGGVSDTFSVTTKDKPSGKDDGGGGGGCFIATAAFGSPLAEQVEILRQFRDRHLLTNTAGKKFVAWYYRNGPMAAKFIQDKPPAKMLVRVALYPLIGFSLLLISGYLPVVTVLLLLSALVYLRLRTNKSGVIEDAKL